MLHDGLLRITGDAEGALEFRGADGHLLVEPATAGFVRHFERGAALRGVTQGGCEDLESADAALVLATMGRRGGWHIDAICDATGLTASAVFVAMGACEITGRVRCDSGGRWAAT